MSTNTVNIVVKEDGSRVVKRNLEDVGRSAEKSESQIEGMKAALTGFVGYEVLKKVVEATVEAEDHFAQLQAAVKATGGVAGFTAQQLVEMSSVLEENSKFSDDAVQGMQALLLSFKNIRGPEFIAAQQAIVDLSTRMGGDLQGAALQVGKALQNPTEGLTMLGRAGVTFSAQQKKVIKDLQQSGDIVGAQQAVLQGLTDKFGGAAQAARNTFGGALAAVKNQLDNLLETSGGLPAATESLNELASVLKDPAVKAGADSLFSIIIRGAAAAANVIGKTVAGINVMFTGGADEIQKLDKQIEFLQAHRSGVVTVGANPYNDSTGVDFMGTEKIDKRIAELKATQEKLLGVGINGVRSSLQEFTPTASRDAGEAQQREIELTDEQIQALENLKNALTAQSGEQALLAKYGQDNARAMDAFKVSTELTKVGIQETTPELKKLLDQLASNRASAAARQLTDTLKDQIGALNAQVAAGDLSAQALERYQAQLELTKQGAGKLTPQIEALFTAIDKANALKAVNDAARDINQQVANLNLDAQSRQVEEQVQNATKGLSVTKEQTAALREQFRALQDLNQVTAAQDQLLSDSVDKRKAFTTQLDATKNLLNNPASGFTKADATNSLAAQNPDLFAGTQEQLDAQQASFQQMYDNIDQMRQKDLISEQTAQQLKAKVQVQQNTVSLQNQRDFFGNLATLATSSNKKVALIGRAAAVTQATIDGVLAVQKALASAPPPYNYALAAAVGIAAAANVAQIVQQGNGPGFATGGSFMVGGSGGVDSQTVAFRATPGEQVAVSTPQQVRKGDPNAAGSGANAVAAQVNQRIINVLDPALVGDFLATPQGESVLLNVMRRNSDSVKSIANS